MKRRHILSGALGWVGAAPLLHAQTQRPPGKIGFLAPGFMSMQALATTALSILRPSLQRLGYVEGETMLLRFAEGDIGRLPQLAAELIALKVGVLMVVGPHALRAASQATKTLPIVAIDLETDPVRAGLATSLARPGGNVTGLFMDQPALAGKWIELLREAVPTIERLALLWDPDTGRNQLEIAQSAARAKGLATVVIEIGLATNYDDALRALGGRPRTGIAVLSTPSFRTGTRQFGPASQKLGIPSIAFGKLHSAAVLMTYGPNQGPYYPRAVVMADKILRGANPADMAIEAPDRFELVVNLKTAKALGLTIPQSLLLRADEVIE